MGIFTVLSNTTFWTGVAFVLFVMLCIKYFKSSIVEYLERYAKESSHALIQAKKANKEAKQLLIDTIRKEEEAKEEIKKMFIKSDKDARAGIANVNKELKILFEKGRRDDTQTY